jgi:uncharacterized protein YvpB
MLLLGIKHRQQSQADCLAACASIFEQSISIGLPVIVAVQTWPLVYWQQMDTDHAVVVVGLDEENFYLYDPYFATFPQIVDLDSFLTAWSERDFEYGILGLSE